jgi:ribosomal protein S18 acetylase RimI-like enzyme
MDNRVIDGFVDTLTITPEQQTLYMLNNAKYFRVALVDGKPSGYVGVIHDDIRICTHPNFQGIGVGKFMIAECLKIWPNAKAKVKPGNIVSDKLFKSCGFKVIGKDENFTYYKLKNKPLRLKKEKR